MATARSDRAAAPAAPRATAADDDLPWLGRPLAQALATQRGHALLVQGPPGVGQFRFCLQLAQAWLCEAAGRPGDQPACGACASCHLFAVRAHPDLLVLLPEALQAALGWGADDEGESRSEAKSKAKPSAEIKVDAVRKAVSFAQQTSARGGAKVVVLHPAEQMNAIAANTLLKTLEEPPGAARFILSTGAVDALLPTIRSRCQQWHFARPSEAALALWMAQADRDTQALLALGGGMPLAAERLAEAGGGALLARFVRDIGGLQAAEVLRLAGQWEAWLKSKEAAASGFGLPELSDWMQRWVSDLAAIRLGGRVRFFPAQESVLAALASRMSVAAASGCYNELAQIHKVSRHPLSLRLVLEDMLMRYARAIAGARG